MFKNKKNKVMHAGKQGFTLIEILITMAILVMLAAIVIVAINPARQFAQARNTQRWSAVNSILNAVHQNMIDNQGVWNISGCGVSLPSTATIIKKTAGSDICGCLVPAYLVALPYDSNATGAGYTDCNTYDTAYTVLKDATTGRITIAAPQAELSQSITVTR